MTTRPIFFSHIQKTAGTSLAHMLRRGHLPDKAYPDESELRNRGLRDGGAPESKLFLELCDERIAATTLFTDHLPPYLTSRLPHKPQLLIMLRDPIERALSHLGHVKRYMPRFAEFSLSQLFENRDLRARLVAGFQTRFLSTHSIDEAVRILEPRVLRQVDLDRAIEWLNIADCVAITESFALSARVIGRTIGRDLGPVEWQNRATEKIRRETTSEQLRERIADAVGLDRELHVAALQIFRKNAIAHTEMR